jgi:hypothetical protein
MKRRSFFALFFGSLLFWQNRKIIRLFPDDFIFDYGGGKWIPDTFPDDFYHGPWPIKDGGDQTIQSQY